VLERRVEIMEESLSRVPRLSSDYRRSDPARRALCPGGSGRKCGQVEKGTVCIPKGKVDSLKQGGVLVMHHSGSIIGEGGKRYSAGK